MKRKLLVFKTQPLKQFDNLILPSQRDFLVDGKDSHILIIKPKSSGASQKF